MLFLNFSVRGRFIFSKILLLDLVLIEDFGLGFRLVGTCAISYMKFSICCSLLNFSRNRLASECSSLLLASMSLFKAQQRLLFWRTCRRFLFVAEVPVRKISPYSRIGSSMPLMHYLGPSYLYYWACQSTQGVSYDCRLQCHLVVGMSAA